MSIEVLHVRDADGGCTHAVYVDGVETNEVTVGDVDPGRGWERADWQEHLAFVQALPTTPFTQAFTTAGSSTARRAGWGA